MKRNFLTILCIIFCFSALAQVQNGYIRTKGTSTNRYGSPIPQVQVYINGLNGAKVTAANGTFNFNLGGGKTQYSVASVVKTGYSLFAPLASAYNVGKARLELVMQSRAEKRAEEARITEKVEENITKSYETKMAKLQKDREALRNALNNEKQNTDSLKKQIHTLEEQIAALDKQYQKRNDLIDKMVEEYVKLDYATLDDRKAQLCAFIENGELERADSLLNTIDIKTVMSDIKTLDIDIEKKVSQIATEKDVRKQKVETACMYWRGKYDVAVQNMQYDSAMVYVKQLADVDTTNCDNVDECAYFHLAERDYVVAEKYYNICKRRLKNLVSSNPSAYCHNLANIYNSLGNLYRMTNSYDSAMENYQKSLSIWENLAKSNPLKYNKNLANTYNNFAACYDDLHAYDKSNEFLCKALSIYKDMVVNDSVTYKRDLAAAYHNLGIQCIQLNNYDKTEQYYLQAISTYKELACSNKPEYKADLATCYMDIATLYDVLQQYDKSEKFYIQSLAIFKDLAASNASAYNPNLADTYINFSLLYYDMKKYDDAEKLNLQALLIYKKLSSYNPAAFNPTLANAYEALARLYNDMHKYDKAEENHLLALHIFEDLFNHNPAVYSLSLAMTYGNIGIYYYDLHKYKESEGYCQKCLSIFQDLASANPSAYNSYLAKAYSNMGYLYKDMQEYDKSEDYYYKSLSLIKEFYVAYPSAFKTMYSEALGNLSYVLIFKQKFAEAESKAQEAINSDSTQTWLKKNLVYAYLFQNRYAEAEKVALEIKDVKDKEDKPLKESILEELKTFEEKGIIPKKYKAEVEKLRAVLNQ